MPHVEAFEGMQVFDQLTTNDSWIKMAYFLVEQASRAYENPIFGRDILKQATKIQTDILSYVPHKGDMGRKIDPDKLTTLYGFIRQKSGGLIVMRHGQQYIEEEEREKLRGSRLKISSMQLPFNDEDPASAQSLAEAASLALVIKDIASGLKLPVDIITSRNARAADIAAIISMANGKGIRIDDRLTCVNYPIDKSEEDLNVAIGENNNGALTWNRGIIDSVCGEGTYEGITRDMTNIIMANAGLPKITICLTHTPQMNAADLIANGNPSRVPELGFRVFHGLESIQFPDSIFES